MPLELVPTLLGLRILTDVHQGAPAYLGTSGVEFNEHTRGWLLEWGAMDAFTSQQMPTHVSDLLSTFYAPALALPYAYACLPDT